MSLTTGSPSTAPEDAGAAVSEVPCDDCDADAGPSCRVAIDGNQCCTPIIAASTSELEADSCVVLLSERDSLGADCPAVAGCPGADCAALETRAGFGASAVEVDGRCELQQSCDPRVGCDDGRVCLADGCDGPGICMEYGPAACPETYEPVCGCDGVTYDNGCLLHGAPSESEGECAGTTPAELELLAESGIWESESFEDPLAMELFGPADAPAARVCSISLSSVVDPNLSPAEQMLSGSNCDDNPEVSLDEETLVVNFIIPWPEVDAPTGFDMTLTHSTDESTLAGSMTLVSVDVDIDVVWTRVESNF